MTTSTPTTTRPRTPAHVYWIPVVLIVACAAIGLGVLLSVWGELPDPIAHHWGADGKPDQWSPLMGQVIFAVCFSLLMPLGMHGLGAALKQPRLMGPIAVGMAVFLSVLMFGGLYAQRGLADARDASDINGLLWWGMLGALAVGVILGLALRDRNRHVASRGPAATAPHLEVAPGTSIAWTGHTRVSKAALWFTLLLAFVPLGGMAVVFFALRNPGLGAFMLVLLVAIIALCSSLYCHVTIDARSLRAVGLGLIPWVTIPLEQVEEARLITIDSPLGDFGGYGYRGATDGSGGWALVTAPGEAVVIERSGKGPLAITLDGSAEAAAVLNTLALRHDGRVSAGA